MQHLTVAFLLPLFFSRNFFLPIAPESVSTAFAWFWFVRLGKKVSKEKRGKKRIEKKKPRLKRADVGRYLHLKA